MTATASISPAAISPAILEKLKKRCQALLDTGKHAKGAVMDKLYASFPELPYQQVLAVYEELTSLSGQDKLLMVMHCTRLLRIGNYTEAEDVKAAMAEAFPKASEEQIVGVMAELARKMCSDSGGIRRY